MIEFQKILLPVDFSPLCEFAARYVARLATAFGSQIHVLHVVPVDTLVATVPEQAATFVAAPQSQLDEGERMVDAFVKTWLPDLPVEKRAVRGIPAVDIAREARELGVDLIVMGTRAEGVVRRLVFGSVSKSVLESAPCAVLLVPLAAAATE